jgi:uncharacterized protein YndB with AHSA1/START domain
MCEGGDVTTHFDPRLDLSLERIVAVPAEHLWRGWTDTSMIVQWFTPAPWVTSEADVDPRPGGVFRTVMCGPDGERNEGTGCVLEAVPNRRFSWTGSLLPGFRPAPPPPPGEFAFAAIIEFEPVRDGTLYRATVRHADEEGARTHAGMGFEAGWGAALDQLVALYR